MSSIRKAIKTTIYEQIHRSLEKEGFYRIPIPGDGNCFYTACSLSLKPKTSKELRNSIMDFLMINSSDYSHMFESPQRFINKVRANRRSGVWNTEISDLAPFILARLSDLTITIFNASPQIVDLGPQNPSIDVHFETIIIQPSGDVKTVAGIKKSENGIHLVRSLSHYDALVQAPEESKT